MPAAFPLHFVKYRDLPHDVARLLGAARGNDPFAAWPAGVIVASGGVSSAIAREVVVTAGRAVAGLQTQTIDAFAQRLLNACGEFPRVARDDERRLAMRSAVRAIDHPVMKSRGIAAMLERSYRDVRDAGLTLETIRSRAVRASLHNRERSELLFRAWATYERRIADAGAIDPADLLARAAVHAGSASPQIVAGFYDMTGAQLALIEALAAAGKVLAFFLPAGDGEGYRFAGALCGKLTAIGGTQTVDAAPRMVIRTPTFTVAKHERRDLEIEAVCERVADLLRAGTDSGLIGITSRSFDDDDLRLLEHHAKRRRFSVTRRAGVPLRAHPIGRIISTLLRLRERNFPRADVLQLVRDGLRTTTALQVEKIDALTRRRRIVGGTSADLRRIGDGNPSLAEYITLLEEVEPLAFDGSRRGAEWASFLSSVTSRCRMESQRDLEAAARVDEVAALFRRADRMNVVFDAESVLDAIEQQTVEGDSPDAALPQVWLGDVMKLRGHSFEHLFALRMQDESFPQRRIEDPLVPDTDRRALGIREIGDGRDEEQMLFQLLLDAACSTIHFSFSASDGFGKVLRPSQLLENHVIAAMPERKVELLEAFGRAFRSDGAVPRRSERPARLRVLQRITRAGNGGAFDGLISDPILRDRFRVALGVLSPTQLEDYGECPQKFLWKHVLRVGEFEEPERDLQIDPRNKGSLNHRILEELYRSITEDEYADIAATLPALPASFLGRLDRIVDEQFSVIAEDAPPANENIRAIELRATKRNLRAFIALDIADLIHTGLRPRWFEYSFGAKYAERGHANHEASFIVPAGDALLRIDGRIDRIDTDGSRYRVVDYKSGKGDRHADLEKKIDRGIRLQLALYAMAVAEFFGVEAPSVSGTIKPIAALSFAKFQFELAEKTDTLRETLDLFGSSIAGGLFPAFADESNSIGSCKYCPVNPSCRTLHDDAEKYQIAQSQDARTLLAARRGGAE